MPTVSKALYRAVRAGLICQGTSLQAWCAENRILRSTADKALLGERNGPKARALRARIATEAGVNPDQYPAPAPPITPKRKAS